MRAGVQLQHNNLTRLPVEFLSKSNKWVIGHRGRPRMGGEGWGSLEEGRG